MNKIVNGVLIEIRKQVRALVLRCESAMGGPLSMLPDPSDLLNDSADAVDRYLADIASQIILTCEADPDEALDFVMDLADQCAEEGHISEMPDEEAEAQTQAVWLGKAATYGLGGKILAAAREHFGEQHP